MTDIAPYQEVDDQTGGGACWIAAGGVVTLLCGALAVAVWLIRSLMH